MKFLARLSLMGSGLGLIFLTAMPSFATVVGTLNVGGPGTVTVTPTGITFTENDTNTSPASSTQVAGGTTLTYAGSPALAVGDPVDINGGLAITPTGPAVGGVSPIDAPVLFPNEPSLSITLTTFGPGTGTACTAGMTVGQSCSPLGGTSPIILTDDGPSLTFASLSFTGTATDGTTVSAIAGGFTEPIPEGITSLATSSGFTTPYSGVFTATTVPEPRSISVIAIAGLLMGLVVARRRKSIA
jgi:hypothetical protein